MKKLGENQKEIIKETLQSSDNNNFPVLVQELSSTLDISVSRVYEISKSLFGPRRKNKRIDKGEKRKDLSEEVFLKLCHLRLHGLSAEEVIMRSEVNGWVDKDYLKPTTLRRWFSNFGINPKSVAIKGKKVYLMDRAYSSFRAHYPTQIWHWDSTTDQQYYLDTPKDDTIRILFEDTLSRNKNRKGNERPRIYIFQMIDSCSGVRYIKPYTAENSLNFCLFLWECIKHKSDNPMQGIPHLIVSDNASIFKTALVNQLFTWLDIKSRKIPPGESWQNGKVERAIGSYQKMTGITKIQKFKTLLEYNDYCNEACCYLNNKYHSGVKGTPWKMWQSKLDTDKFRNPPDQKLFLIRISHKRVKIPRSFHNFTINGLFYLLPYEEPFLSYVGKDVDVYAPQEDPSHITIHIDGKDYRIDQYDPSSYQLPVSTNRPPKSKRELNIEKAWGTELGNLDLSLPVDDSIAFLPVHGKPFGGEVHIPCDITYLRALDEFQNRGLFSTPPSKKQCEWLKQQFKEREKITMLDLEGIISIAI